MGKRANPMKVNAALTYDVEEAARALGKSKATIRNWVRLGLPVMASKKPMLILGRDLRDFIRAQSQKAKAPLDVDQLYCPRCRQGRHPTNMAVILHTNTPTTARLGGICVTCGATATRFVSVKRVCQFSNVFEIKKRGTNAPY
jgi:hypothetical protein